jgi:uncharacterized protein YodC (DUF2158 family)
MIDIETLKIGDVVQLASGSPYMTVQGFRPVVGNLPGSTRKSPRTHVCIVVWSHRHGFLKEVFQPEELRLPLPREPRDRGPETGGDLDAAEVAA